MVTALAASAALLMAGAASAQGLLDGIWGTTDDKNPNITATTEVLVGIGGSENDVEVRGVCEASTGEKVRFTFDMLSRPSKTTITETKATIDKNRREEPAAVWVQLPGNCAVDVDIECFEGAPTGCPGEVQLCLNLGAPELLNCDRAKIKSTVNAKSGRINWSADAQKCPTGSEPLTAAVVAACSTKGGINKGMRVTSKGAELTKIKITGKENDVNFGPM
jgi:hypothetical protein